MSLDELGKRYLRIQRELGGNEVILSGRSAGRRVRRSEEVVEAGRTGSPQGALGGAPITPVRPDREGPPPAPEGDPVLPPLTAPIRSGWRSGAPPIPTTPGIRVLPPERGLMDIPLGLENLDEVSSAIAQCQKCFLCQGRTNTVPGEGSPRAGMMFVGEGPGQVEDETGRPFVGRAGELLTQIIHSIGLRREEVFIANAVKCRAPGNRKPLPNELAECFPYLERQIELIRPKVLVALGATAVEALLQVRRSLAELRGRVHSYRGIPLVVTYHPAALLRNPNWKKPTWDDIRIARQLLDR